MAIERDAFIARIAFLDHEVKRLNSELVGIKLLNDLQAEAIIPEPAPKRPRLTRNAAYCDNCKTTIESTHRHHWVQCNCVPPDNGIYVDGGLAYSRRGAGVNASYTDLCEYEGD